MRRADTGETIIDTIDFSLEPESNEDDSSEDKIETLAEMICRAGDQPAAALFVLMGTLESSTHPKLLANTAKHFAVTRCVESNLYGIVHAHLALVEAELLSTEGRPYKMGSTTYIKIGSSSDVPPARSADNSFSSHKPGTKDDSKMD